MPTEGDITSSRHVLGVVSLGLIAAWAVLSSACEAKASPSEAVASSAERFTEAKEANSVTISLQTTTTSEGFEARSTAVSAFAKDGIIYSDEWYEWDVGEITQESRVIVVDGDLYATDDNGVWFVLSPWHQGTRPENIPDLGISALLSDFERIAGELDAIEAHSNDEIDGVVYRRYSGELDWETFVDEDETFGYSGAANVDLWVSDETGLPFRMDVVADLVRFLNPPLTLTGTQTFEYAVSSPPDPPANAKPWRDLEFPEAPCTGEAFEACLEAQTELTPISVDSCEGEGRRICFVPIGNISGDLVVRLVEHYRAEYGIDIGIMTPLAAPEFAAHPERNQIDAAGLLQETVGRRWPQESADGDVVIIGITPVDMYDSDSHFRYVFGVKYTYEFPKAIVSMFRMTPEFYGAPPDPDLTFERTQKLLGKYIGMLYYGLPTSSDSTSQMFDNILGAGDLDRMNDRLPVD